MRTTVILPDELYRQVKERARAEDRTITSFMEDALRRELARREAQEEASAYLVRPFSPRPGMRGTLPGVDVMDKDLIQDLLDEDDVTMQQIRARQQPAR